MAGLPKAGRPSLKAIGLAQSEGGNLRRQAAARRFYAHAKLLHFVGFTISVLLAVAGPIVAWRWPEAGARFGAAAGLWIFVSRLLLIPLRDKRQLQGALAQEMFDCDVLGIEWSPGLGEPLAAEDIHGAAKRVGKGKWSMGDWYPTDSDSTWPRSVLICQRSNAVWARRQHGGYGWFLAGLAAVWGLVGIVVALALNATLAAYLTSIALPALPAILDASEEARAHFRASAARQRLESAINQELNKRAVEPSRLRAIQDQVFLLRRQAPLVPDWFYKLRQADLEADMRDAAKDIASDEKQ